jgi:septum formation protein
MLGYSTAMALILASASPRRRELLERAGIEFVVRPAAIDETLRAGEPASEFVRRMAREKALKVAESSPAGSLVLGADTVVEIDGEVFGKPSDEREAAAMLRRLSGRTHCVVTGVCLVRAPDHLEALRHETTSVTFCELPEEEIAAYVASGEPLDKAGAYAIQGQAAKFIRRVDGCFSNVVGLPLPLVCGLLKSVASAT